jgi:hypothetical protein
MIIALYIVAAVIMAVGSLYLAWQNREFRKFLAGAFFVVVAAPSSISSSSCSVSILAL